MDKFLESQTFKTGAFVLFVIFVLLLVFKMGVFYGYKKANFLNIHGVNHTRTMGSQMFMIHGGMYGKETNKEVIIKKHLIKDDVLTDFTTEGEPDLEEIAE